MTATSLDIQEGLQDLMFSGGVKFGLLAEGAVVDNAARQRLDDAKQPLRTRSGISGGLDIRLPGGVEVNVPIDEPFAQNSSYTLGWEDDALVVRRAGETLCHFEPLLTPEFYGRRTTHGDEPMYRIAQMCSSDRLCYGMTGATCYFWARSRRCQYCSIGKNSSADFARKQADQLLEVLTEAVHDPVLPARHVLLGGGTPPGDDMGALMAANLCEQIKTAFPRVPIYVMIAAPLRDEYLERLHDAGADEIGINLEFWTDEAWRRYIPGKDRIIGKQRYLSALETCVDLWGPVRARSILIAGLEPLQATYEAATALAGMGVMPIVSPFRPLKDTVLEDARGASGSEYVELWQRIDAEIAPLGVPLGPACAPCQNNTLALPTDARYHR